MALECHRLLAFEKSALCDPNPFHCELGGQPLGISLEMPVGV